MRTQLCRQSQGAFFLIELNEFSFKLDGTPLFHNSLSLRLFKENEAIYILLCLENYCSLSVPGFAE